MTRRRPTQIYLADGAIGFTDLDLDTCAKRVRRALKSGGGVVRFDGRQYELAAILSFKDGGRDVALADLIDTPSKRARPTGFPRARSADGARVQAPEVENRPSPALNRLSGSGDGSSFRPKGRG